MLRNPFNASGNVLADQFNTTHVSTGCSFSTGYENRLKDHYDSWVLNYRSGYGTVRHLNPNLRFVWNGWHTDLHSLSMAGWQVAMYRDHHTMSDVVSMVLPAINMHLPQTRNILGYKGTDPIDITEDLYYSKSVKFAFRLDDVSRYNDTTPFPAPLDEFVIRRWQHQQKSPEIIVPKETVGDLLERITTMQQDARIERIRAKLRENSVDVPLPDMTNVTVIG